MRELSLRPYHGKILLCESLKELRKQYVKQTGEKYPYQDDKNGGRYVRLHCERVADVVWLVFAKDAPCMAHEFSHVLLHTFATLGHNPTVGDGEPFCYMLSQLMIEAYE